MLEETCIFFSKLTKPTTSISTSNISTAFTIVAFTSMYTWNTANDGYTCIEAPGLVAQVDSVQECNSKYTATAPNYFMVYHPTVVDDVTLWKSDFANQADEATGTGSYQQKDQFNQFLRNQSIPFYLEVFSNGGSRHQSVIYKRRTSISQLDIYDLLTIRWYDNTHPYNVVNEFNTDFDLFDNLEDAINENGAWQHCNFNHDGVGFPRDCGKYNLVPNMWIGNANNVQLYDNTNVYGFRLKYNCEIYTDTTCDISRPTADLLSEFYQCGTYLVPYPPPSPPALPPAPPLAPPPPPEPPSPPPPFPLMKDNGNFYPYCTIYDVEGGYACINRTCIESSMFDQTSGTFPLPCFSGWNCGYGRHNFACLMEAYSGAQESSNNCECYDGLHPNVGTNCGDEYHCRTSHSWATGPVSTGPGYLFFTGFEISSPCMRNTANDGYTCTEAPGSVTQVDKW